MEKDYSLLRPFDLEKAKAGEAICYYQDGTHREFITGPDDHGYFVIKSQDGWFRFGKHEDYRMAPLAWVEGKPVYKGDVLYGTAGLHKDRLATIKCLYSDDAIGIEWVDSDTANALIHNLTWTPPKKTREVKLLGWLSPTGVLWTKREGVACESTWLRVPSEDRTVTVEE